jgi:Arc/MetJ-type ribon-helix-helix transcriptional regulator
MGDRESEMTGKIAITLPQQQIAIARRAVAEGRAASVSAYISQAMARRDADEELAATLAKARAGRGAATSVDREWARHTLGLDGELEDPWSRTRRADSR